MHLHKVHITKVMEMWPYLVEGLVQAKLDPEHVLQLAAEDRIDVFLCKDPKVWFHVCYKHCAVDLNWTVMHVLAGWGKDKLSKAHCIEVLEILRKIAKGKQRKYVLYNSNSQFLGRLLQNAGEELWQPVKW